MADFVLLVPIDVIARILLGVDNARLKEFRVWSEGLILGLNPFRTPEETEKLRVAADALSHTMRALMAARRAEPADDLVTDLVQLQAEGADLTDGEISSNLQGLLVGGNLTTTDLIGNAHPAVPRPSGRTRQADGRSCADQFRQWRKCCATRGAGGHHRPRSRRGRWKWQSA